MLKKKSRKKTIAKTLVIVSLLGISLITVVSAFVIMLKVLPFMEDIVGRSRVEVLEQIADSNAVNRETMTSIMDSVFDDLYDYLIMEPGEESSAAIKSRLTRCDQQMAHLGLNYSIDVVMKDKREFYTNNSFAENVNVKNTYWYIQLYMGEKSKSWTLYHKNQADIDEYELVYGRAVHNEDGKVIGVILVSDKYEQLFRSYQNLLETVDRIFIIDNNGYTISHSNPQAAGILWVTNMDRFEERYAPYNSYRIVERNNERLMIADYRDEASGWVFVTEQNVNRLMVEEYSLVKFCIFIIVLGLLVSFFATWIPVRIVTNRLRTLSDQVSVIDVNHLQPLEVDTRYEEPYVLGVAFNDMIDRVNGLIKDIEKHEAEKRKTEFDFLHAQLNPHFLNNTMVAIKSLIAMNRIEQAEDMMQKLLDLLNIPATPEIQFVTVREELHLIEHFVSIMSCRTEKEAQLLIHVPAPIMELTVPRMILQPIVGNSFFHGFADKDDDCTIEISASYSNGRLIIRIRDNGEGMNVETVERVMSGSHESSPTHHGIGLRNVQRRLQIVYGEQSVIRIDSIPGTGTTVELLIDHYVRMENEPRPAITSVPAEQEARYE